MAETTLNQLAASIARRAGLYAAGTATAGTTTTLTDANLIQPDNLWNNCYVHFLSGTYAGQERLISTFDQDTATITFAPALAGAVASGMTYEICPLQRADIHQAIEDAIRRAGQTWQGTQLLADSTDTLSIGEPAERQALAFVEEYALHLVHEMLMARNVTGEMARVHLSLSNNHLKKAEALLEKRDPNREPRTMRTWRVGGQV